MNFHGNETDIRSNHNLKSFTHAYKAAQKRRNASFKTCNICSKKFKMKNPHERFCNSCRHESELYHYYEWLPKTS